MTQFESGGQAALVDTAPALLHFNSLNMIVLRLDDKANFFFCVHGSKGEKRQISTMQLTKIFKSQLRPPYLQLVENVQ